MRSLQYLAILLIVGCASASRNDIVDGRVNDTGVSIANSGTGSAVMPDMRLTTRPGFRVAELTATPDSVWALLPTLYGELGIPVSTLDNAQKVLVALNTRVTRIGGRRLSTYFDCGGTYSNNADSGNAYVTVRTQILPATTGTGSIARVEVRAVAGASGGVTVGECGSKGTLEQLIVTSVAERLAKP